LEAIDNSTCNKTSNASFTLSVKPKPTAGFSFSPNPPKENTDVVFTNQSIEAKNYVWIFDDGDTLITSNSNDPISHTFNASQTYRVTLIALSESGCADTIQHDIKALVTPIAEVANAITPNGINRTVQVRGYGIDKMKWAIYNRWGQKVFETSNMNDAWDGKLNGQILQPDVYTYTLDVTFTSRDSIKKTGDITLIK
jgi:gliding motility-associated-like protein